MRLIDGDALKAVCDGIINCEWNHKTAPLSWADAYEGFEDDIDAAPTIPAIPVAWISEKIDGYASRLRSRELDALVTVLTMWQKEQEGR